MNTRDTVIDYLEQIAGQPPVLVPMPIKAAAAVPVFLMELYDLFRATLFGRGLILAIAKGHEDGFTPAEYAGHAEQLRDALNEVVALVLPHVTSYDRDRLVKQGVAFIVPERQLFLPQLLVDLRDYFPRKRRASGETISYPAQVVVLYHLLKGPVEPHSLRELANRLGYSPMSMSTAGDELCSLGLCEAATTGRERNLHFKARGRKLWKQALPVFRTPVRIRRWVRDRPGHASVVCAGITALAAYTQIGDDPLPTYAMRDGEYRKMLETGGLTGCHGPDEAHAQIEAWFYDPALLADNNRVDRLSLFLTLRNSADERVTKALRELLEGVQW
jgi:DNA-binding MarR family transcriptional regulator